MDNEKSYSTFQLAIRYLSPIFLIPVSFFSFLFISLAKYQLDKIGLSIIYGVFADWAFYVVFAEMTLLLFAWIIAWTWKPIKYFFLRTMARIKHDSNNEAIVIRPAKQFWKTNKQTIGISFRYLLIGSLVFAFSTVTAIFLFDLILTEKNYYHSPTILDIISYLFSFLMYGIIFSFLPGILGGLFLDKLSLGEIQESAAHSVSFFKKGAITSAVNMSMICLPVFLIANLSPYFHGYGFSMSIEFNTYILLAISIAFFTGGFAGKKIHERNLTNQKGN